MFGAATSPGPPGDRSRAGGVEQRSGVGCGRGRDLRRLRLLELEDLGIGGGHQSLLPGEGCLHAVHRGRNAASQHGLFVGERREVRLDARGTAEEAGSRSRGGNLTAHQVLHRAQPREDVAGIGALEHGCVERARPPGAIQRADRGRLGRVGAGDAVLGVFELSLCEHVLGDDLPKPGLGGVEVLGRALGFGLQSDELQTELMCALARIADRARSCDTGGCAEAAHDGSKVAARVTAEPPARASVGARLEHRAPYWAGVVAVPRAPRFAKCFTGPIWPTTMVVARPCNVRWTTPVDDTENSCAGQVSL